MKNNKVFLSVVAAIGLNLSLGANAAVVSITTGANPYYQYQQENLASQQQQQTLPQSATNIQAQQRMQTIQQQNTEANSGTGTTLNSASQSYQDAAQINQQVNTQESQAKQKEDTGPKNAFEQGYGNEQDALAQQEALEKWASLQSARQKGEIVNVPSFKSSNAVGYDKHSNVWLINWKGILVEQVGMKPEKVDFEASRLNKEDFAAWASRQVRYVEPNTIAVNP